MMMMVIMMRVYSVRRQEERYEKCRADYVQFVDDKKRQQLSYNDEQIHKYRRYVNTPQYFLICIFRFHIYQTVYLLVTDHSNTRVTLFLR